MTVSSRRHGPPPSRRTQEERRSTTRRRLLDATMECLVDLGWSGTSTTEVARRAGVSRGAQQHHYPTKMELVTAALEHMLQAQRLAYETAFAILPAARRNVEGALDLLWEVFRGRPAKALMELAVAGRTDDELRPLCRDMNERIIQVIMETFVRLFPANTLPADFVSTLLRALYALYIGLSVQNALDDDADGHQAEVLAQLKAIALLIVPETGGPVLTPSPIPTPTPEDGGDAGRTTPEGAPS
ncbi:TetR/AcrR family transcriptional regulator [Actinomadura rubteroloni]|nr:TetR/AcrR family transcriptional regulator [Actinomadura rubteroloni]